MEDRGGGCASAICSSPAVPAMSPACRIPAAILAAPNRMKQPQTTVTPWRILTEVARVASCQQIRSLNIIGMFLQNMACPERPMEELFLPAGAGRSPFGLESIATPEGGTAMRDNIIRIIAIILGSLELLFSSAVLFMTLLFWPGLTYAPVLRQFAYYFVIILGPVVLAIALKWPRTSLLLFWLQPGLMTIIYLTNP